MTAVRAYSIETKADKAAHPDETPDYKTMMQSYIKGVNPND